MKCNEFQSHIPDLLDGSAPAEFQQESEKHLTECPACASEYAHTQAALGAVTPHCRAVPSNGFKERVLHAAARAQTRRIRRRRLGFAATALSAAVIILAAVTLGIQTPARAARSLFREAAVALSDVKTMQMELRIRTLPNENFSYTDPEAAFVPHKITVIYGPSPLWRIEKSGRTAVCDGELLYMWSPSGSGTIRNPGGNAVEELKMLIDPRLLMHTEQAYASEAKGAEYAVTEDTDAACLTVTVPAQGDFSRCDYLLNTSITETNTRREYRFDRQSGHLLSVRIMALTDGGERTLLETTKIGYDLPIDREALTALPAQGIVWTDLRLPQDNRRLAGITSQEAAERILGAMTHWDRELLDDALSGYAGDPIRERYEGIVPAAVGKPFRSGTYAGEFVPCKIVRHDGSVEQLTLALRNDNPARSWVVDGGI